MTKRFLVALAILAMLALGNLAALVIAISADLDNALVVDLAGQQRMLSQRIALFAGRSAAGELSADARASARGLLREAARRMQARHEELLRVASGGQAGIGQRAIDDIRNLYLEDPVRLDDKVRNYVAKALRVADQMEDARAVEELVQYGAEDLLGHLDKVVKIYRDDARRHQENLIRVQLAASALMMTGLIATGWVLTRGEREKIKT